MWRLWWKKNRFVEVIVEVTELVAKMKKRMNGDHGGGGDCGGRGGRERGVLFHEVLLVAPFFIVGENVAEEETCGLWWR